MTSRRRVVVVGGSQAGCASANALRGFGFDGDITVVGAEPHPPYNRPPLSKSVLVGAEPDHSVFLPVPDGIRMLAGMTAVGLDRANRLVELADGDRLPYDGLVIATGARARRLGQAGQRDPGEVTLRDLDDAVALRQRLGRARDVVVVGGGFLGMEVASAAASLGKTVTVVDRATPLVDRLGPKLSGMLLTAAGEHGVRIEVVPAGVRIERRRGVVDRLLSADGTVLAEADLIVTAAGDVPNTEWLHGSGIEIDCGVVIDRQCRVAPDIVGAGDVVSLRRSDGRRVRSPHWWNALAQARIAAATLLGREPDTSVGSTPPFFWTEAFGLKIRLAGHLPPAGEPTVIDGSVDDRRAVLVWPTTEEEPGFGTAAAVNATISVPKLTKLAQQLPAHPRTV
ncbi:MAG TPA: FAD-dependent oxidoreductase [Pseudonocardiaceae bacterium]|jgi:NADPH-dependent 2,4-dienoyl-CoA reductase/sulfur reductase-like enzyme